MFAPATVLQQVHHFKVDVIAGDPNAAAYRYYQRQEYQDLYNSSVAILLREMQREVNTGRPFERRLHIDHSTNNHPSQLGPASDLDCCFVAVLSLRKLLGSRIMRNLWSNTHGRAHGNEKRQNEDSSYPKGIEILQRETAKKVYPDQEMDDPMVAPRDFDIRLSGRVMELENKQNKDLWILPTDILVTIR